MKRGLFITFEGPDGSGKSTILQMLYHKLIKIIHNHTIVLTREPGGHNNIIAEDIRNILLNKVEYKIDDRAEALLFAASRAQHVKDFILPNLNNGNIVLCDRYIYSSLAYQGYARGLGFDSIWEVNNFAIQKTLPDLTIVLMIKPEVGIERIKNNTLREYNRLDQEKMELHKKVYEGYQKIIEENRDHSVVEIDANADINTVLDKVYALVLRTITEHYGE